MGFVNGLDVSDFQPGVDWTKVRAAGYSFAIAKATQGTGNTQATFAGNLAGIRGAGMVAGAYHFLEWDQDPVLQARHFLTVYTPKSGDLPPTLDCEACDVDSATAIAHVSAFIAEVEKHLNGRRCLLYMSYSFAQDHLAGGSGFSGHPLWVAGYSSAAAAPVPAAWSKATIWQWSDTGGVSGIAGNVDLDRFVGSIADLHAFTLP